MITQQDREFVDFLFGKLTKHVDMEMVDLHDDDTAGIDMLEFDQLTLLDWPCLPSLKCETIASLILKLTSLCTL